MEACCLDVDLAALSDGDSTLIGDRGVTLSGGQRQRVSLARAVYSDRDVYLLDDPLAAVDPDVALTVFRRVVLDFLNNKTVLLVTHQPQVTDDDPVVKTVVREQLQLNEVPWDFASESKPPIWMIWEDPQ